MASLVNVIAAGAALFAAFMCGRSYSRLEQMLDERRFLRRLRDDEWGGPGEDDQP